MWGVTTGMTVVVEATGQARALNEQGRSAKAG